MSGIAAAVDYGATPKRFTLLPDIPAIAESGYPGFESVSWYGLVAPAKTPAGTIAVMHREVLAAMRQPDVAAILNQEGAITVGNLPQEFAKEIRDDTAKWAKIVKDAKIPPQ